MENDTNKRDYEKPTINLAYIKPTIKPALDPDYFDTLTLNVLSELDKNKKQSRSRIVKRPLFWLLSAVAASFVLFFGIRYFNRQETPDFDSLSETEILTYVEENMEDFDDEMLAETIVQNDSLDKLTTETTIPSADNMQDTEDFRPEQSADEILESLTKEEILQYFNSDEIDPNEWEDIQFQFNNQ